MVVSQKRRSATKLLEADGKFLCRYSKLESEVFNDNFRYWKTLRLEEVHS